MQKIGKRSDGTTWPPAIRRNWGYWDGVAARERNCFPEWSKVSVYRTPHPFDKAYGEGFWTGWYGEVAPAGASV
jgi:hypothetical protein